MLTKEHYNLTKKELKLRKIWAIFTWSQTAVFGLILIGSIYFRGFAKKALNIRIDLTLIVVLFIIFASLSWWLFYHCVYRKCGVWFLRFQLISNAWGLLKMGTLAFSLLFLLLSSNTEKYGASTRSIVLFTSCFLLFMALVSSCYLYLSFKLIKTNKKMRCTRQVSDDLLAKIQRLSQLENGDQRSALYGSLVGDYPYLNWLISRAWKRKENLITIW